MSREEQTQEQSEARVVIKKYSNRRLYDTSKSSYVTLEDLCRMVQGGSDFMVVDAKSGEDLTRVVLTQIIFEQEQKGYNLLPEGFLRHVIRFYDHNLSALVPAYLEQAMQNFAEGQDAMNSYLNNLSQASPLKGFEEVSKQNMEMFGNAMNMFNPFFTKK